MPSRLRIKNVSIWWSLGSTSRLGLIMMNCQFSLSEIGSGTQKIQRLLKTVAYFPWWSLWSSKRCCCTGSSFQSFSRHVTTAYARFALIVQLFSQFSHVVNPCVHISVLTALPHGLLNFYSYLPRRCHCGVLSCPKDCSDFDEEDEPSAHLSVNSTAGWLVVISLNCACTKCVQMQSFSSSKLVNIFVRGVP